jgi:fructokinase
MSVWVCGEALIDLLPTGPVPGGGPANTAIALARLGIDVHFVGGLSDDEHGQLLRSHLAKSGVLLDHAIVSELPTALAVVTLNDQGSASYEFRLDQTATFSFDPAQLPVGSPTVLHIGSLATVIEPAATALFEWASKIDAPIVFDPNVRPAVNGDADRYRRDVEKWASIATIIKLSDDDLRFLYPNDDEASALKRLMQARTKLIVLTRGSEGITAVTSSEEHHAPSQKVDVVDTVGAGDTVGAVFVEALVRDSNSPLTGQHLDYVLNRAVRAAAITCSRAGCQPPTSGELE